MKLSKEEQRKLEKQLDYYKDMYKGFMKKYIEASYDRQRFGYELLAREYEGKYIGTIHTLDRMGFIEEHERLEYLDQLSLTNE